MFKGNVTSIHITAQSGGQPQAVSTVRAVAGQGLEGDRNFYADGSHPLEAVTLIEAEALDALAHDYDVTLGPGESRRNIVTTGVPLNHLVGQEFCVGEVRLRGTELCEPCKYLASKTHDRVLPGLIHRGGLRAEILSAGEIRVGDAVEPAS
jgi:MOSC domain-containing protein YiiM